MRKQDNSKPKGFCVFQRYLNGPVETREEWNVKTAPMEECSQIVCISDKQPRVVVSEKSERPDDE